MDLLGLTFFCVSSLCLSLSAASQEIAADEVEHLQSGQSIAKSGRGDFDEDVSEEALAGIPPLCFPKCNIYQTCVLITCVNCFYGSNTVRTKAGGEKMLKNLQLNDEVLVLDPTSGRMKYERVLADVHRDPSSRAVFYRIVTGMNHSVTLTPDHYLYAGCSANHSASASAASLVTSKEVRVGDTILVYDPASETMTCQSVSRVQVLEETGVFNPVVASGSMVVGGVLASVYADDIPPLRDPRAAHALLWLLRQIDHQLPSREMLKQTGSSGMPYWAYYPNMIRTWLI